MVNGLFRRDRPGGARYGLNLLGQAAGRGIYLAAGFCTFVMVGRSAGPETLGRYGLALAVLAVAVTAADFGTTLTFGARLGARPPAGRADELARMLTARLILGAATGVALLCALPLLPAEIRPGLALAALAMPLVAARFLDAVFQVCGRPGWSAYPALANAATLVGGTGLALAAGAPEPVLAAVAVAAGIAYGAVGLALAGRLLPLHLASVATGLATVRAAGGIGLSNALGALNGRIGLLMLALVATAADLGSFTAGLRVFEVGAAVAITVCAPLVPVFGRAAGAVVGGRPAAGTGPLRARTRTALTLALSAAGAGTVAAWATAEPLVALLFGRDFSGAVPAVRAAAAMSGALIAATILFAALVPLGRTGFAVRASAGACLVNLAAGAVLIPWSPVTGAALAALAAELAMLAVVAHAFWRALGPPLAVADAPILLGPGLVTLLAWAACPAGIAPATAAAATVAVAACAAAAGAAALRLRSPPAPRTDGLDLPVAIPVPLPVALPVALPLPAPDAAP